MTKKSTERKIVSAVAEALKAFLKQQGHAAELR